MTLQSVSYGRLLLTSCHFHAANCLVHYHNTFSLMTLGRKGCHFLTGLAMPVLVAPVLHFHFISFYLYARAQCKFEFVLWII